MHIRLVLVALAIALTPLLAAADRGAVTIEAAPVLTLLPSAPSQGSGSTTMASVAGGLVGVRYGLRNDLELTAAAFYEAPASYFHAGVRLRTADGSFGGTLAEREDRLGGLVGVRFVRGLVWRFHLGADVGWSRQRYWARDLIDVSDPGNAHSFGLGLAEKSTNAVVLAPVAGIEWQITDRWTIAAIPRVELSLGGVNHVAVMLPISVGYSWYVF
jgi:hypothetical protein